MGEQGQTYTLDEALEAVGFGKFQIFVLGYAGMGLIAEAMEMMLLSFVGPAVQSAWGLSPRKESYITSVVFAGMLVGAYSWGIVSDKHGRRKGFLITAMITAGAGFLSAFAPNYICLISLRCLVGLGLGGGPVLSSWFLEFIPASTRGTWMVVFSTFWTLGTILEASLAWFVMPSLGWRWLLALSSLPTSLLLVFYVMTPESPRFLCLQGRRDEALVILKNIAKSNQRKLPPGRPCFYGLSSSDVNYRDVFITSFAEFPGLLVAAATVDRMGRLLFGARICITATFTVVYIYAPEIYPTAVRTTGVGVASSVGRIGGMLCPLVAVGLIHGCHQTSAILLFEVVIFLSGVCVLLFPFETSGRELTDYAPPEKATNTQPT
ncbi:Organic cation/carnitine transporter 7 [Heracleum sosnowskyi]|uniref:Organic cation/carnitine transporter 7 n=1 Tax=Heracleum sosnowskyi TaxID=360622 RepID=A0AAD8NCS8_9APIA|nr:Organic cation/carnitine transporter 7 [Heracleum sosnowskyi]